MSTDNEKTRQLGPGQVLQAPRVRVAKPLELRLSAAISSAIRALREANKPDAAAVDERGVWLASSLADLLAEASKALRASAGKREQAAEPMSEAEALRIMDEMTERHDSTPERRRYPFPITDAEGEAIAVIADSLRAPMPAPPPWLAASPRPEQAPVVTPAVTGRLCECGCGEPVTSPRPEARYATPACRVRAHRAARASS